MPVEFLALYGDENAAGRDLPVVVRDRGDLGDTEITAITVGIRFSSNADNFIKMPPLLP